MSQAITPEANAVRPVRDPQRVLTAFPAHRIRQVHPPGDQVVVTHRGEIVVYDSPPALADAMREHDPQAQSRLLAIDAAVDRARELVTLAEQREADARVLLARARRARTRAVHQVRAADAYIRKLWLAAGAGVLLALIAFGCGL